MKVRPANSFSCWVPAIVLAATLFPSAASASNLRDTSRSCNWWISTRHTFPRLPRPYGSTRNWAIRKRRVRLSCSVNCRRRVFVCKQPVADEPTAFVATYGQGEPVIGILGEFDALPGLSQAATPDRSPVVADAPGHGCGHNLLGSGAALAAVALKEYMERNHVAGTLRYYGTPAEEGGDGKVYMIRAGLFRDVDVVLQWHPASENAVSNGGMLAINSARFLFHGVAAHAAMAPERGRSALDAVMLMGNGIEFLREHIPSNSRIHYIITNGGAAPNVVPDTAELYLYARNPSLRGARRSLGSNPQDRPGGGADDRNHAGCQRYRGRRQCASE